MPADRIERQGALPLDEALPIARQILVQNFGEELKRRVPAGSTK
jgi:hypothetical protein